jgi:hypothetical protein
METTMTKLMLVLAAALVLGASSAAYASGDIEQSERYERFSVAPQGQVLGTPNDWQGNGRYTYGFELQVPGKHPVHRHTHPANVR